MYCVNLGTEAHFIRFIKLWENHNITVQLLKLLSFLLSFPAWEEKTWLWLRTLTQLAGSKEKSWTWCLVFSSVSPEWYVSWTLHIQSVGLLFKHQWLQISCEKDFFSQKIHKVLIRRALISFSVSFNHRPRAFPGGKSACPGWPDRPFFPALLPLNNSALVLEQNGNATCLCKELNPTACSCLSSLLFCSLSFVIPL